MIDREHILEQLSAYMDGELSPSQAQEVEQALAADAALARELEQLRRLRQRLRDLPCQQAPQDFVQQVLEQGERLHLMGRPQGAAGRDSRWMSYAAVAACVTILISLAASVVFMLTRPHPIEDSLAMQPAPAIRQPERPIAGWDEDSSGRTAYKLRESDVPPAPKGGAEMAKAGSGGRGNWSANNSLFPKGANGPGMAMSNTGYISVSGNEADAYKNANIATNIVIYTDEVAVIRKELETALGNNGFAADAGDLKALPQGNPGVQQIAQAKFKKSEASPEQVQYVAYGTPEQVNNLLQNDLNNDRLRRNVSNIEVVQLSDEAAKNLDNSTVDGLARAGEGVMRAGGGNFGDGHKASGDKENASYLVKDGATASASAPAGSVAELASAAPKPSPGASPRSGKEDGPAVALPTESSAPAPSMPKSMAKGSPTTASANEDKITSGATAGGSAGEAAQSQSRQQANKDGSEGDVQTGGQSAAAQRASDIPAASQPASVRLDVVRGLSTATSRPAADQTQRLVQQTNQNGQLQQQPTSQPGNSVVISRIAGPSSYDYRQSATQPAFGVNAGQASQSQPARQTQAVVITLMYRAGGNYSQSQTGNFNSANPTGNSQSSRMETQIAPARQPATQK